MLGRVRAALLVPLVVVLSAAGCSAKKAPPRATGTTAAPTTTTVPALFPLTGLPVADPALAGRPALAVKIDNIAAARPQAGLVVADVIYEELAEGGLTRFIAVFHSTDAPSVGPVRSVRPSDPDIVAPLDPLFAYSGGAPAVVSLLPGARLTNVGVDAVPQAYARRSDRRSPQNLYSTTAKLYAGAPASAVSTPPPALGPFAAAGQAFTGAGAAPATGLTLAAGPTVRAVYAWDAGSGSWRRSTDGSPHLLEGGAQLAPTNVVVQFTPYSAFPADSKVSVAEVVGSGDAWVLAGGMVVKGRWSKSSPDAVTTYTDSAGAPIALLPGRTLVHLVRPGSAASTT